MKYYISFLLFFVAISNNVMCQEEYHYVPISLQDTLWWKYSENPALVNQYNNSLTILSFNIESQQRNQLKYRQEGETFNRYNFQVERTGNVKKWSYYGKLGIDRQLEKGVEWNSMFYINGHHPYVVADSIKGDVNREVYTVQGKASYEVNSNNHIGFGMSYNSGKAWKVLDPRMNNDLTDLHFNLGYTFEFGNHLFGTSAEVGFKKELLSSTNVREGNRTSYFLQKGFGLTIPDFSYSDSYYRLNYNSQINGFTFNYSFRKESIEYFFSFDIDQSGLSVIDPKFDGRIPSSLKRKLYLFDQKLILKRKKYYHYFFLKTAISNANGIERVYERVNIGDTSDKHWQLLTEASKYFEENIYLQLSYKLKWNSKNTFSIENGLAYKNEKADYVGSQYYIYHQFFNPFIHFQKSFEGDKVPLSIGIHLSMRNNVLQDYKLKEDELIVDEVIMKNLAFLNSNTSTINTTIQIEPKINDLYKGILMLNTSYTQAVQNADLNNWNIILTTGLKF